MAGAIRQRSCSPRYLQGRKHRAGCRHPAQRQRDLRLCGGSGRKGRIAPDPGRPDRRRHSACRIRPRTGAEGRGPEPGATPARSERDPDGGRARARHRRLADPLDHRPVGWNSARARAAPTAMSVSAPFISRPVATSLLSIAVLLVGWLGFRLLPVSSLPEIDFPAIQVSTQLPGAGPDTMASLVTTPLEQQLGQIAGLTLMTSTSSFGMSVITMQFVLDRDIDSVGQDVQAAINAAGAALPTNLPYPPIYKKVNPADQPILILALTSHALPITNVNDVADTVLAQKLSEVTGVGA